MPAEEKDTGWKSSLSSLHGVCLVWCGWMETMPGLGKISFCAVKRAKHSLKEYGEM